MIETRYACTVRYPPPGAHPEAENAVRALGVQSMPVLLRMLQETDSADLEYRSQIKGTAAYQRWLAIKGFYALGATGKSAVSELLQMKEAAGPDPDLAYALAGIGLEAVSTLKHALANKDRPTCERAIYALGLIGPADVSVVKPLLEQLTDKQKNSSTRMLAAWALGFIGKEPDKVVPVLIECLSDPAFKQSEHILLQAIGQFGPRAKAAVPQLLTMIPRLEQNSLPGLTNTLRKIDPENRQLGTSPASAPESRPSPQMDAGTVEERKKFAKFLATALTFYADDNQQQLPTNFSQIARYLGADTPALRDTLKHFEIVVQGVTNMASIRHPSDTIVIREKQPWQTADRKWGKAYAFADGHAEIHFEATPDFEIWEREHTVAPTATGR